jgi:hypothetical protein
MRKTAFIPAHDGIPAVKASSFPAKKLDTKSEEAEDSGMVIRATTVKNRQRSIVGRIRARIEAAGERVWRATDFQCADRAWTAQAIAQSLSRLSRQGVVRRLGKGLYYRGRETAFGPSLPSPAMVQSLPIAGRKIFPSGHAATAAGLAAALSWRYPQATWFFAAIAALAAMQRVVSLAHYPSDVCCGAALGLVMAAVCLSCGPRPRAGSGMD